LNTNKNGSLAVIEIGAGSNIPTIRHLSEQLGQKKLTRVLRINPREAHINAPHLSFSNTAAATLDQIEKCF